MIVRSKTKRRLLLLVIGGLLTIAAAGAFAFIRVKMIRAEYLAKRQAGIAAFKTGDYASAIDNLSRYVNRYGQRDTEALRALADARRRLETPDGKHLLAAMQIYKRLLEVQPDHEVRRELLRLYTTVGHYTEAVELSTRVLSERPNDLVALQARAQGRTVLRQFKEALEDAQQALQQDPLDVATQSVLLELYRQLDRKNEILPHAQALLAAHPQDPRAELVMAFACLCFDEFPPPQRAKLQELLRSQYPQTSLNEVNPRNTAIFFVRQAAQRTPPDADFVSYLVLQLDQLRLPLDSIVVLERALERQDRPLLRRSLHRRLFEAGRYADLEKRLSALQLTPSGDNQEAFALKGVTLALLNRPADAAGVADALAAVSNDRVAAAWAVVLKHGFLASNRDPLRIIEAIRPAVESQKYNPYLWHYLGEAYALLSERDQAIAAFQQATSQTPLWTAPWVRLSSLYLEAGQPDRALAAAKIAASTMSTGPNMVHLALTWASTLDRARLHQDQEFVKLLADIQRVVPGEEQTLPLHLLVLARSGQQDAARKTLQDLLASPQAPSQNLLLRLAAVSREAQLGLEKDCYALSAKLYGLTPDVALIRASELAAVGKPAEGAKLLEEALQSQTAVASTQPASAAANHLLPWRLALARYLDAQNDPRASTLWTALGDDPAFKSNLALQRAAVAASSVQSDAAFLARTIDRLRALTGEDAAGWRLARARLLLRPDASAVDQAEAIKLLTDLIAKSPNHFDARLLLGAAHARANNADAAIEQFVAVLKLQPDSIPVLFDLIRLYQAKSDFAHASELLTRLQPTQLDPNQRRQFAALLAQQGEIARAAAILETSASAATRPADNLLLADLYRRRNQNDKAEQLYREMLKAPTFPAVVAASGFFASIGRADEAEKALQSLSALTVEPGLRELALAEHYASYGKPEQAILHYQAAAAAAPANISIWQSFINYHLRLHRIDDALSAITQALKVHPAHKGLLGVQEQADGLRLLVSDEAALSLVAAALQTSSDSQAALESLRIITDALRSKLSRAELAAKLRPIADRTPRLVPLQAILIQQYLLLNQRDNALTLARRGMAAAPASADAARIAATVFALTEDWPQALAAGNRWRELTLDRPLPADLFLADIHLRNNNLPAAQQQIAAYLPAARSTPDQYVPVLAIQANILIRNRQPEQAAELFWPCVAQSLQARRTWMQMALTLGSKPDLAAAWLQRLAPVVPENPLEERLALTLAWQNLAELSAQPRYLDNAAAILVPLAQKHRDSGPLLAQLAAVYEAQNRLEEAEQHYRRALQLQPDIPVSQNNLAMLILRRHGDLNEAASLAAKAIQSTPNFAPFRDTLAQIQIAQKDYDAAITTFLKAIELDPSNPDWKLGLAETYEQAGRRSQAVQLLPQIDALLRNTQRVPPNLQARLDKLRAQTTSSR